MWFGSYPFFLHSRVSQHSFSFKATGSRGSGAMLSWKEARRELWEIICVLCEIFLYWVKYFMIWKKKIGIKRGILLYLTDSYVFADRQIASVAIWLEVGKGSNWSKISECRTAGRDQCGGESNANFLPSFLASFLLLKASLNVVSYLYLNNIKLCSG